MKDEVDINISKAKKRMKALTKLGLQRKINHYVNELSDYLIDNYDMIDADLSEIAYGVMIDYFSEDLDSQTLSGQILGRYADRILKAVRIKVKKYQKEILLDIDA